MNGRLPRLVPKHIYSFHGRGEKFRLKLRLLLFHVLLLHVNILVHPTSTHDCGCLMAFGSETYQVVPTPQVSWGEVLVTTCALLNWFQVRFEGERWIIPFQYCYSA